MKQVTVTLLVIEDFRIVVKRAADCNSDWVCATPVARLEEISKLSIVFDIP